MGKGKRQRADSQMVVICQEAATVRCKEARRRRIDWWRLCRDGRVAAWVVSRQVGELALGGGVVQDWLRPVVWRRGGLVEERVVVTSMDGGVMDGGIYRAVTA